MVGDYIEKYRIWVIIAAIGTSSFVKKWSYKHLTETISFWLSSVFSFSVSDQMQKSLGLFL